METKRTPRKPGATPHRGALHLRSWLVAVLLLLAAVPTLAQSGSGYDLSWSTVDGGGGTFSSGGLYSLGGTAGQPDAGSLAGGLYILHGGFWAGASAALQNLVYLPLVMREH